MGKLFGSAPPPPVAAKKIGPRTAIALAVLVGFIAASAATHTWRPTSLFFIWIADALNIIGTACVGLGHWLQSIHTSINTFGKQLDSK